MNNLSISVAMAAYNGEKYIYEQIQSILNQLTSQDELIISMDPSQDKTAAIVDSFHDNRMKRIQGPGKGSIKNFENAIKHCQNPFIFLSDQDDIWLSDKRNEVLKVFDKDTMVVMHDAKVVNEYLKVIYPSYFAYHNTKLGIKNNIVKNSYMGCCMAFKKELIPFILPFPDSIPMHDQWIGLVGEKVGNNKLLKKQLILYRRHENNVSNMQHASIKQMIQWRMQIIHDISKVRK